MKTNLSFWRLLPLSILLLFVALSLHAQIPTNGLIAYYPFNGNANDASGNNFNGTVVGATLTTDRFGNANSAYAFNGTSNYISIADNNTLDIGTNDYSLVAWIKTSVTGQERIISKGSTNCTTGYMIRTHGTNVWVENAVQPSCTFLGGGTKIINNNIWHCVTAVVTRNSTIQIYVDGVLDKTFNSNTASSNFSNALDLRIGTNENPNSFPEWFNGSIDDIRMYNRALTSTEVVSIYNEPDYKSCRYQDSLQLIAFYTATNGNNWTNRTNWLTANPINTWYGVTVNAQGCVVCIDMDGSVDSCSRCAFGAVREIGNNLSGSMPTTIGNLSALKYLILSSNPSLAGAMPASISDLSNLINLDISNTAVSGSLPTDIGRLTNLVNLALFGNKLSSSIPASVSNLKKLSVLGLAKNQLDGTIPADINNLKELTYLGLFGNKLTGSIPNLDSLKNLRWLFLNENQLDGRVADYNLPNLTNLSLFSNRLSGDLPSFQYLTKLRNLHLYNNDLSGCFPTQWQRFCRFTYSFDFTKDSSYNLSGNPKLAWQGDFQRFCNNEAQVGASCNDSLATTIDDKIQADCSCRGISTTSCRYQDSLALAALYRATNGPNWINKWILTQPMTTWYGITTNTEGCVTCVDLDGGVQSCDTEGQPSRGNNLIGTLPDSLRLLQSLQKLVLSYNQISGTIPNFSQNTLQEIGLNNNLLSGTIPNFNLPNVQELWLGNNQLTTLPALNLPNLTALSLDSNLLRGVLSSLTLPKLQGLDLSSNQLSGNLPDFSTTQLVSINASYNSFSGGIPTFPLPNLTYLYLNNNQFTGTVPNFSSNPNIRRLFLNNNQLEGCFPQSLQSYCSLGFSNDARFDGYNFLNNLKLPWQGDFTRFCNNETQVGASCNDGLVTTANDKIQADCTCRGINTNSCRYSDSLALVDLYNNYNGRNWQADYQWIFSRPMTEWRGVHLNEQGCVFALDLNGDQYDFEYGHFWAGNTTGIGITGNFPTPLCRLASLNYLMLDGNTGISGAIADSIQYLTQLRLLYLHNCSSISGAFPNGFWNLSNLEDITLHYTPLNIVIPSDIGRLRKLWSFIAYNAQLFGELPPEMGLIDSLQRIDVTNNKLTKIPSTFSSRLFNDFKISNNPIDSLPILRLKDYGWSWTEPTFWVDNCQLTFDDLLPNLAQMTSRFQIRYTPQAQFFKDTTITVRMGDPLSIDLKIDAGINSNRYVWWKDNARFIELGDTLFVNKLNIPRIQASHFGTYEVRVTNPNAPLLTLQSRKIKIVVQPNTSCRYNDSLQLVSLYAATNGSSWINKWDLTKPIDTWYGVTLNTEGCVTCIDLDGIINCVYTPGITSGNGLSGTLPNLNLPALQTLSLHFNNLTDTIPNFNLLPNLTYLGLCQNRFTGSIPTFDLLPKLQTLDLAGNSLSGSIPNFNLLSLEFLSLADNPLGSTIPNFNLPNLKQLYLSGDRLMSNIPNFNLPKLEFLVLSDNRLNNAIPNFNMPNLKELHLYKNQLTGSIPNFNLPKLRALALNDNQLSGCIPQGIKTNCPLITATGGNITNNVNLNTQIWASYWNSGIGVCSLIDTTSCRYRDSLTLIKIYDATNGDRWINTLNNDKKWKMPNVPISNWYGVYTNDEGCVIALDFDGVNDGNGNGYIGNGLKGAFPESICQLSELKNLYLSANKDLTGNIPNSIGRLTKLTNFHFNGAGISGALPDSLWALRGLQGLSMSACNIGTPLSSAIGNLDSLYYFIASGCNITGKLPSSIANLKKMDYFLLANNPNLTGTIPTNINQMSVLRYFNLGGNNINGSIPNTIGQLSKLETLILGGNKIDGNIPSEIGDCRNLQGLYLSDNGNLTGAIPSSIGNLRRLKYLWLQGNKLQNEIPLSMGTLDSLEDLVLSRNQLTGKVPTNINQLKVKRLYLDNNFLDSIPLLANIPITDSIFANSLYIQQLAGLHLENNHLTFDDIEPNKNFINRGTLLYSPQDTIFQETTLTKNVGETVTINLGIDGALTTNKYVWFKKQGNMWVRFDSSNVNTLILRGVSACDAGDYKCEVTNAAAPLLTLNSRTIKIVVNGALSSNRLDTAICYGQTYRLPDNQTVNATTSFRDTVKNIRQCDSLIRIVNLTVSPKPDSTVQNAAICFGKTYTLPNGQMVTPSVNTVYRDTILLNGCPSRFRVTNLTVNALPMPIVNDTAICSGNSARLWIRNNSPNFKNYQWQTNNSTTASATYPPSVSSTFFVTVTDVNGCIGTDSARITVNSKPTAQITNLNSLYCKDNSTVTLKGQPTGGTFRLDGNTALNFNTNVLSIGTHSLNYIYRDANNCADTATQTFRLADVARNTINRTICLDDTITINQKKYYKNKLTGIDTLRNASKDGCDSILTVQIAVYPKIKANDDSTSIGQDKTETTINVLTNDIYPTNMIDVNIVNKPRIGSIEEKGTGLFNIQMPRAANGFIPFNYEICQMGCPNDCDTAMVKVFIKNANPQDLISTAITPNGDGNNDVLDFPEIDWVKYPNARMEIFNRWGQFVFVDDHYKGKWGGLNQNGQELMAGDYFFILQLIIVGGPIMMGSVYLQR